LNPARSPTGTLADPTARGRPLKHLGYPLLVAAALEANKSSEFGFDRTYEQDSPACSPSTKANGEFYGLTGETYEVRPDVETTQAKTGSAVTTRDYGTRLY
jgi:hypothetical protein